MRRAFSRDAVPELGAVLAGAVLIVAAACGGSEGAADRSRDELSTPATVASSGPYPGAGENCPTAEPAPVSLSQATAVLRQHGFSVSEVPRSCGLRTISAMLTNATSSLNAMKREGTVDCFLLVAPPDARPQVVGGDTAAASAERRFANLHCNLYGPQRRGFAEMAARLDRAFAELKRATTP